MGLFRRNTAIAVEPDRRLVKRHSVDCPARLKMAGGDRQGRLSDISEAGVRFHTDNPPVQGISGMLEWNGHEYFGKVVWVNDQGCGVVFERAIPSFVVEQTVASAASEVATGPVAKFGNIPLGQKRGLRVVPTCEE